MIIFEFRQIKKHLFLGVFFHLCTIDVVSNNRNKMYFFSGETCKFEQISGFRCGDGTRGGSGVGGGCSFRCFPGNCSGNNVPVVNFFEFKMSVVPIQKRLGYYYWQAFSRRDIPRFFSRYSYPVSGQCTSIIPVHIKYFSPQITLLTIMLGITLDIK